MKERKKLKNWLMNLKNFIIKNENTIIVVEGKRDKMALEKFEIGNVYSLKGMSFHNFSEMIAEKIKPDSVILITDFDSEGEIIGKKLHAVMDKYNISVNTSFREALRETEIKFVEEIPKKLLRRK